LAAGDPDPAIQAAATHTLRRLDGTGSRSA
jgi:hypothetical protein